MDHIAGCLSSAEANDAVQALLSEKKEIQQNKGDRPAADTIAEGHRNDSLYRLASSLVARGAAESTIRQAIHSENQEKCSPPLPDQEVDRIIKSALRYESGTKSYYPQRVSTELNSLVNAEEKTPEWLNSPVISRNTASPV